MYAAVAVLTVAVGAADAGFPWGAEAFSAPVEVLRAATSTTERSDGAGQTWLYRGVLWSIDAERRVKRVHRTIVRIDTAEAVRSWSTLTLVYAPQREVPPLIRARVVTPDGRAFQLTPEMVHEDVPKQDHLVLTDDRSVSAALPGVRIGAVVELELTWRTTAPLFAPAQADRFSVNQHPVASTDIVLEHPRSIPLAVSFTNVKLQRADEDEGTLHRVRLHADNLTATGARRGLVAWTTAASWQAVVRGYQALLEPARAAKTSVDVSALVAGAKTRREKAQRLLEWVSSEVRYTGLEFGERNIVPWGPAQVLERGFGDCKDLALLLIDVLGRAGIEARVALLDTEGDLEPKSPSLSFFDHAIVYVPAARSEPALWIDATATNTPAGMLPTRYAGELALIIDPATTKLVPTWSPSPADNERKVEIDVTLAEYGGADVRVTQRLTGLNAAWARDGIENEGAKWMQIELADLGKLVGVQTLEQVSEPSAKPSEPVVYAGKASRVRQFYADWSDAVLRLPERVLFDWYPDPLTQDAEPKLADGELTFRLPNVATVTMVVHPSAGFVISEEPTLKELKLGPAVLKRSWARRDDGSVELSARLDSGPRKYSKADVDAFRAAYAVWKKEPDPELRFAFEPSLLHKQGKLKELVAWYAAQRTGREPVGISARYAGDLLLLGLADAARDRSLKLVTANPDNALAWLVRGWVLTYDRFGNGYQAGYDRPGALAALKRALELEPGCTYCVEQIAWLEGYDDDARWLSNKVDASRAVAAWTAAWPKDTSSVRWVELMVFAERWSTLKEHLGAPSTDEQRAAILLADQMLDGTDAAWKRWSTRFDRDDLTKAVSTVVAGHLKRRRVNEALALSRAAGLEKEQKDLARLAEAYKKPPKLKPEVQAVYEVIAAAMEPDEKVRERFAATSLVAVPGGDEPRRFLESIWSAMEMNIDRSAEASAMILAGLATLPVVVENIGADRRVKMPWGGAEGGDVYLERRGAQWRMLVAGSLRDLAARALQLSDTKRADDARAWFSLVRTAWNKQSSRPELALVRAIDSAWPTDDRLLAAALSPDLQSSRKVLEGALATAPDKVRATLLKLLQAGAMRANAVEETTKWVTQLEAALPDDPETFQARLVERAMAKDLSGREAVCKAWLAKQPSALMPQATLAELAASQGQYSLGVRRWRELLQKSTGQPWMYNSAAWEGLFVESETPELLEWANKAVEGKNAPWSRRHTLATALASDAKDIPRTLEVFRGLASPKPEDAAWIIPARLAHRLGLRDEARELYKRIAKPTEDQQTTEALAMKWLAELEQSAPSPLK